jgi:hypothetical protein
MADGSASKSPTRGSRTICLPAVEESYLENVNDAARFRGWLEECFQAHPELFPAGFDAGFEMKDQRTSKKSLVPLRRIRLRNGQGFTVRPSFVTPYMTARTDEIEKPLFLRKFGVPFWALTYVFGRNPMYWFRLESSLGRNSIVGTTVRQASLPEHLLADEHHQTRKGEKVFVATTVGGGCILGAEMAEVAGTEELGAAYGVFRAEARNVTPDYQPQTVNTDGWKGTRAAWALLFPTIVLLRCYLHAWLKIRDRAKNLKETYFELATRVWEAYHAPDKRTCSQRLRHLKTWAEQNVSGVVLSTVLDLCEKRAAWLDAYDHPQGHRTSNMLDRVMRGMNRYFFDCQHLHGGIAANNQHVRGWALLWNFTPWSPATVKANNGWQSPAQRLNQHRYHENWLHNLLVSASLGGYRTAPQKK